MDSRSEALGGMGGGTGSAANGFEASVDTFEDADTSFGSDTFKGGEGCDFVGLVGDASAGLFSGASLGVFGSSKYVNSEGLGCFGLGGSRGVMLSSLKGKYTMIRD